MTTCLWGILKRLFHRDARIQDRAENCNERITFKLIQYMWQLDKRVQPILKDLERNYPDVKLIVVKNRRDLQGLSDEIA
jgi:hypothetical protein